MITKLLVITVMLIILFALGSSLYFLIHDDGKSNRIVKALTWRIGLSVTLFIFLFIGFSLGWITPHWV